MSIEIREQNKQSVCSLVMYLQGNNQSLKEFLDNYIFAQVQLCPEDPCSEFDESEEAMALAAGVDVLPPESYFRDAAKTTISCLTRMYLGVCAIDCDMASVIREKIISVRQN